MLFLRHATTRSMRDACFPGDDEADPASLAQASGLAGAAGPVIAIPAQRGGTRGGGRPGRTAWVSPAPAATRTAHALGLLPQVTAELAEADAGRWRGLPYARVARDEPDALAEWLADPHAAPHGGESRAAMAARVAAWVEAMRGTPGVIVVCDAGVIRAALGHALGLGPAATARFDIAPLSSTEITPDGDGWRVVRVNHRKATL